MNALDSVSASTGLRRREVAGLVCLVLLLAGCAGGSTGQDEGIPQLSLSPVSAASPAASAASPAGSGSARDQQIAAGAEAIRAYRQMIFDIYADPNPNVQDMRKVATGELLERDIKGLRKDLAHGVKATEGSVEVKWIRPVFLQPTKMRLYACVDPNGILTASGSKPTTPALSQAVDYVVQRRDDDWLVARVQTHGDATGIDAC